MKNLTYEVDPQTGCWMTGHVPSDSGYVTLSRDKKSVLGHRWVYERFKGPIPDGLSLDHLCRNKACINPDHLEPVTHRVNVLRGIGPTAINAAKTFCKRGHEFTPENTYTAPGRTWRNCRECGRQRDRERAKAQRVWQ